jgi:hypothetical protein
LPAPDTDWYVEITTLLILTALSRGFSTTDKGIVQQFGFAIMPPLKFLRACKFASGTINGTLSSSLNNEDLSITIHPLFTASLAYFLDTSEPAQKKAMSIPEFS